MYDKFYLFFLSQLNLIKGPFWVEESVEKSSVGCVDENSRGISIDVFFIKNPYGGKQMNQIETYYVVRRTKEKDEQFAVIDAMSLDEANAVFEIRHEFNKEAMKEGEAFYIFEADEQLTFDENNRIKFPSGRMAIIHKLA